MTKETKPGSVSRARMAVCLCDCGGSLGANLDYGELAGEAGQLPGVARMVRCSKLCQGEGMNELLGEMRSQRISRALIAACTPSYYQVCLDKALDSAGINSHLIGKVNIREHCAWVHPGKAEATAKASGLIAAAAARLRQSEPLPAAPSASAPVTRHGGSRGLLLRGGFARTCAAGLAVLLPWPLLGLAL